jgi:hypothetical protein
MLRALDWPSWFVAIRRPNEQDFSHVWTAASENGLIVNIDPIVPAYRMPIPNEAIAERMIMYV